MTKHPMRRVFPLLILFLLLTACSQLSDPRGNGATPTPTHRETLQYTPTPPSVVTDHCPSALAGSPTCYTPQQFRMIYGVDSLIKQGFTGKGQTIVDIVSFGSPTLQQDMDVFDKEFGLPPITIQVISPIGTKPFDPSNKDMAGWAGETELDVQIIHTLAPDAGIVVLTSPVAETEGTIGLPEFRQLEQYAIDHNLGKIVSQSWGASEVTLKDQAGRAEIDKWTTLLQNATTKLGMTYFGSSGDNGATDYMDLQATKLSPVATTSFLADEPWVTSVGGTTTTVAGTSIQESAWNSNGGASGGGFSAFFPTPDFQKTLPATVQNQLNNRRGVPDVSGDADPYTGLVFYFARQWQQVGGTSASAPLWAALMAIANQMAGHPLGFINPALYKLAASSTYTQDFRDVTTGNNDVHEQGVNVKGYPAVQGWDPVTGLGTPHAAKLLPDLIAAMK